MNTTLRRSLVTVATTLACLALMASPASAATVTGLVTGGTVTLVSSTGTVTDTFSIGNPVGGTGCAKDITLDVTTSTAQLTGLSSVSRFALSTTYYIMETLLTGSTPGTLTNVTSTSATVTSATVTYQVNIYSASNQSSTATDCAHGTTRTCRATMTLSFSGSISGDVSSPAVSDTASLSAPPATMTMTPPCSAPFTTYVGGTASVSGMTLHITSVP